MKRSLILLVAILSLAISSLAQNNVGINDDNSAPNASAMLDVFSANKGLLIPRIALTSTTAAAPVTSPETSLLIYNTATAGDVTPGYYYWSGSKWVRLVANADPTKNTQCGYEICKCHAAENRKHGTGQRRHYTYIASDNKCR